MLKELEKDYSLGWVEKIGHHPDYPVTDNWDLLVEELVDHIRKKFNGKIIGVGHSLGGVLHYLASARYPDLYTGVIMLDSPVMSWIKSMGIYLIKSIGLIERFSPGQGSKFRRRHWPTAQKALQYLHSKRTFARFDEQCLRDYVEFGMVHDETGVHLKFDPAIENQIYITIPHTTWRYAEQIQCPLGLLYGKRSRIITPHVRRFMQKKVPQCHIDSVSGGHLFPFEHPLETAAKIRAMIERF